jgi:uncharacterized protein YjiS (DUF1127 family)
MTPMFWMLLAGFALLAPTAVAAARALVRVGGRLARAWKHRQEIKALAGADARMLADIGLTRADMRDAFATPLWRDPTAVLRARALERRLSRHGIGLGLPADPPPAPRSEPPRAVGSDGFVRPATGRPARLTV